MSASGCKPWRFDEQALPATYPQPRPIGNPWPAFRLRVAQAASSTPTVPEWVKGGGAAAGVVLASALLDKPVDRFVKRHQESTMLRGWGNFGKVMPVALVGAAGAALAFGEERMQNIGLISLQSVAGAIGVTAVGKYAVGRARPGEELGPWSQVSSGPRSDASFPSGHSAVAVRGGRAECRRPGLCAPALGVGYGCRWLGWLRDRQLAVAFAAR
jgi:hypothetical protein